MTPRAATDGPTPQRLPVLRRSEEDADEPPHERRCTSCGQPLGAWDLDKLTGVLNRWGWDQRAPATLAHALGHRAAVALLMVDVDAFKHINDSVGHLGGDAVLRSVARTLGDVTRGSDLVGRFGGDEFVVLLPATDAAGAKQVARRIHEQLRGIPASPASEADAEGNAPWRGCSASIGIAVAGSGTEAEGDLDNLLLAADMALLAAKNHGGNRTCLAQRRSQQHPGRIAEPPLLERFAAEVP